MVATERQKEWLKDAWQAWVDMAGTDEEWLLRERLDAGLDAIGVSSGRKEQIFACRSFRAVKPLIDWLD